MKNQQIASILLLAIIACASAFSTPGSKSFSVKKAAAAAAVPTALTPLVAFADEESLMASLTEATSDAPAAVEEVVAAAPAAVEEIVAAAPAAVEEVAAVITPVAAAAAASVVDEGTLIGFGVGLVASVVSLMVGFSIGYGALVKP